jgi:hypothetical protein
MTVCRALILCAAVCSADTDLDGAQGRSVAERPATVATHAPTIAASIAKSPRLEAQLKSMLPSGMTMEQASHGFRNQGQFIAALQASRSHNIDFVRLKAEMTGDRKVGLGPAIQKLKPQKTTR